jgi:hypothetical protein
MPGDPKTCQEHAKRCWALAAETTNPVIKDSLVDLARRWMQLASDLQFTRELMEEWGDKRASNPQGSVPRIGTRAASELLN